MKKVIDPVEKDILVAELSSDRFLRKTTKGGNELYICNYHNAPNVMQEIGRLREISFRNAGGGTGKEADIDKYDIAEQPYEQLVVWSPDEKEILGGYRYILGHDIPKDAEGNYILATGGLFEFSEKFVKEYVPNMMELGRSFVRTDYQSTGSARKSVFVLDNLWDGLGAIVATNDDVKYLFGKVTMYTHYNKQARDFILYYMKNFLRDDDKLIYPTKPLPFHSSEEELAKPFDAEKDLFENFKILNQTVRGLGENLPPLINSYINLSPTMKTFGTASNTHFGDVEETGILITLDDIFDQKKERYINSYKKEN